MPRKYHFVGNRSLFLLCWTYKHVCVCEGLLEYPVVFFIIHFAFHKSVSNRQHWEEYDCYHLLYQLLNFAKLQFFIHSCGRVGVEVWIIVRMQQLYNKSPPHLPRSSNWFVLISPCLHGRPACFHCVLVYWPWRVPHHHHTISNVFINCSLLYISLFGN